MQKHLPQQVQRRKWIILINTFFSVKMKVAFPGPETNMHAGAKQNLPESPGEITQSLSRLPMPGMYQTKRERGKCNMKSQCFRLYQ